MHIAAFETFYTGSHKAWIDTYKDSSQHHIELYTLKGKYWKWRMHAGAISLAKKIKASAKKPDLILTTDMIDLALFKSLLPKPWCNIPVVLYFHENQLSYPWSENDPDLINKRERHYAFMNYTSALVADHCLFNSHYNMNSFLKELRPFLKAYPDEKNLDTIELIKDKSKVLNLGLELNKLKNKKSESIKNKKPVFLWNHRWEHDKNYLGFIELMIKLNQAGLDFELIISGKEFNEAKPYLNKLKEILKDKVIHFGYADSFETYCRLLYKADIIPVTSNQDFFGISIAEAIYCECQAILPKRLSYEEIFTQTATFYKNSAELYKICESIIIGWSQYEAKNHSKDIEQFDWQFMAPHYDELLKSIILKS